MSERYPFLGWYAHGVIDRPTTHAADADAAEDEIVRIRDERHPDTTADAELAEAEVAIEEDLEPLRGRRFITKFEERSHLHRLHPVRLWRLVLGLGLLAFGIVNIFIPGPGGSVIILASLLVLAGESKLLARLLDWAEVKFERQVDWALQHKIATVFIVSGAAFLFTVSMAYLYSQVR